jgi:putative ABC transport system ATP-binding protein
MKTIEVKNLSKIYKQDHIEVPAVNDVSISFEKGEFTALVGPSGSGKTTMLNLLGGLDQPTSGEVIVDGVRIDNLSSGALTQFRLNNIGFVFQSYNLIPVLTAMENTEFIMSLLKWPREKREQRATNLLKAVGLSDKLKSRPSQMSGGQQQRVAVARALASRPKFILADEPTANLDSKSTENLLDIMEQLNKEEDITFIFSTHDQRVINKARRVVVLEDGQVISDERK